MFSVNHRDLTVITNGCGHRSYQLSHSNSAASSSSQGSSSEGSMNSLPPPSPPRTVSLIHNSSSSSGRSLIHCNNHNLSPCSRNDSQQSLYSAAGSSSQSSVNKSIYEHEYQNLNESLMLENRRLKSEIEILKHRCSKYERVEAEIVKVCQAHEELMASSEKKEQLEKSVRIKLEAEIGRLNQENRELRNRTGTSSSLAEYELQAQRATLEEQRFHIQILDGALMQAQVNIQRLEGELMQAKMGSAAGSPIAQLSPALQPLPPPPPHPAHASHLPAMISVSTTAVL